MTQTNLTDNVIESITTSYERGKKYFSGRIASGNIPACSGGYVRGSCSGGHQFASIQFCGKEYCPDCSRDGSPVHQRRVNRWWNHVDQWTSMGYIVATIPENMRPYFFNVARLKDFRRGLLRYMRENQSLSIKQGLCRWHWFGDCPACQGKGCMICASTGSGDYFHPHLNILFQRGYVENVSEWLAPVKNWMANYFRRIIDAELAEMKRDRDMWTDAEFTMVDYLLDVRNSISPDHLVVNYSYVSKPEMKMNRVKYVTRSTFRRLQSDVKKLLHNFRNSVVWGWKRGEVVADEIVAPECPVCAASGHRSMIHWHGLESYKKNQYIKKYETTGERTTTIFGIRLRDQDNDPGSDGHILISGRTFEKTLSRFGIAFSCARD